jgi:SnoaL-like domain
MLFPYGMMTPEQRPITGTEYRGSAAVPTEALAQFYAAFNAASLDALAVGRERGTLQVGGQQLALAIRTTRVFRRRGGVWRQVHHHGSMDDPAMLEEYQRLILGAPSDPPAD